MKTTTILQVCVLAAAGTFGSGALSAQPAPGRVQVFGTPGGSFLGVNVTEIDTNRAKALNLKDEHGVEITRIEDDSPAAKAGLKQGDVVLEYNGQRVEGTEQFIRLVRETPPGRQVKLLVNRNGAAQTITATTGARRGVRAFSGPGEIRIPPIQMPDIQIPDVPRAFMSWRSAALGIEAESVEGQFAEYFGVKDGVLVRSVMKDSAASKAGLKAGDVILKVDGAKVTTPREVSSAIRSRTKDTLPLTVMRQHHETTVNVTVDEERGGHESTRPRGVRTGNMRL